jgi:Zn-dependent peptidase ImmA (M78 family)
MLVQRSIESEIVSVALGDSRQLPINLRRIAEDIGVGDIRSTNVRHGYTDFGSPVPIIYLNDRQLRTKWRFVFAHELAHVMLRMPEVMRLIQRRNRTSLLIDEEMLADSIAATILMPDSLIKDLRKTPMPLRRLQRAARYADVSVVTLVARMASFGIDIALVHWRKTNGTWHVIDRPGTPSQLHGYVKPSPVGHLAIENLHRDESIAVIDCRINGRHAKIRGRGYRHEEHAFLFIEPSVDIWIAKGKEPDRT